MRDSKKHKIKRTSLRRRAALSVLILAAASPLASADQTSSPTSPTIVGRQPLVLKGKSSLKMLPPLPLKPIDRAIDTEPRHREDASQGIQQVNHDEVKANPFCLPGQKGNDKIQLASGADSAAAIRLKPIGAAIGLHPIGSPKIVRSGSSAMTIEHPEPTVKNNPLIESVHQAKSNLVETVVGGVESKDVVETIQPQNVELTEAITLPSVPDEVTSDQTYLESQTTSVLQIEKVAEPEKRLQVETVVATESVVTEEVATESIEIEEDSEPITFSFSDDSEHFSIGDEGVTESESLELDRAIVADTSADSNAIDGDDYSGLPTPTILDVAENTSVLSMEMVQQEENPLVKEVPAATTSRQAALNKKRYREPVAVSAAPLSLEQLAKAAESDFASERVKPVTAPMLGSTDRESGVMIGKTEPLSSSAPAGKRTPLYMTRAQVRSLTISGRVHQVNIANQGVCQAVASGSNQIKLIGSSNGVTRLVVWATPTGAAAPLMREFVVHVQDNVDATGGDVGESIDKINETIRNAFPKSKISARFVGKKLLVRGTCPSEATAKQIVRMVRKTCLVPVIDEVVVR